MQAILANPTLKAMAMAFIGFTLWAWSDAVIKNIADYPPILIVWFMALAALSTLSLLAPKLGGWHDTWHKPKLKLRVTRGAIMVCSNLCAVVTFSHLELTKAYALIFCAPILAKVLSVLILKEKIRLRSWVLSLIGFSGVLVILRPGLIQIDIGSIAALLLACFFSLAYVMTRYIGEENQTPLSMSIFQYMLHVIIFTLPVFWLYDPFSVPLGDIGFMVLIGTFSGLGSVFVSRAYASAPTAYVAPVHYVQMLWGAGIGAIFFGEYPDSYTLIGAIIIVAAGMALIFFSRNTKPVRPQV